MSSSQIVYSHIRKIRRSKKLSLENLAKLTELSSSYLSQVERGIVNPSLSALGKIAESLEIPILSLFQQDDVKENNPLPYSVITPEQRHRLFYPGSKVANEMLTPNLREEFEFFWTSISPGEQSRKDHYNHIGYECGLIIQGVVKFYFEEETVVLYPGHSICFDSNVPHYWKNIGDCDVHAVWVITPSPFSSNDL